jgi:hypothetical protein
VACFTKLESSAEAERLGTTKPQRASISPCVCQRHATLHKSDTCASAERTCQLRRSYLSSLHTTRKEHAHLRSAPTRLERCPCRRCDDRIKKEKLACPNAPYNRRRRSGHATTAERRRGPYGATCPAAQAGPPDFRSAIIPPGRVYVNAL